MTVSRRTFLKGTGALLAACGLPAWAVAALHQNDQLTPLGQAVLTPAFTPTPAELHLLNRISYGATSAELVRIRSVGTAAYLDEQLHPDMIDDSACDERLGAYATLAMDAATLVEQEPKLVVGELVQATVLRSIASRRQLLEVMVNFWSDHFNIAINKGRCRLLKTLDDRDAIRPHALGRFRDLLGASAHSPAMLFFLDNYLNHADAPNENYAREVMELHTLGVDGGYTEDDVLDVARCFTGWTIQRGEFRFAPRLHDDGEKTVLGTVIPAGGGVEDGERVLDILAGHPSTAQLIAHKLCRRFVSDDPPAELVTSIASVYTTTGGDIREMLRALFDSEAFGASANAKFRRPAELVYALVRASGATGDIQPLARSIALMGHAIYGEPSPRGYSDVAAAWMTTDGLIGRWKFAFALAADKKGIELGALPAIDDQSPDHAARLLAGRFFVAGVPDEVTASLAQFLSPGPGKPLLMARRVRVAVGLLLAAPFNQWH